MHFDLANESEASFREMLLSKKGQNFPLVDFEIVPYVEKVRMKLPEIFSDELLSKGRSNIDRHILAQTCVIQALAASKVDNRIFPLHPYQDGKGRDALRFDGICETDAFLWRTL
jgi:hypothetical protein